MFYFFFFNLPNMIPMEVEIVIILYTHTKL